MSVEDLEMLLRELKKVESLKLEVASQKMIFKLNQTNSNHFKTK